MEIEKFDLSSMNIVEEQKEKLKELFPEVFTEVGKIDFERLKLTLGEDVDAGKERYGMNWPGKAECFKILQQPSIATLIPCPEESIDFETTENLFIEGDNLEVLKLLQKSYLGKIKMIYIDPPYNTGNEFIYPDNYTESLETYLSYTGQIDDEGRKFSTNTETDGRFHSKWLNMMYPRLFLAKNLLDEDGAIIVSIDDNEVNNLKSLINEIFGEENFIAQVIWQKRYTRSNNTDNFTSVIEYLLIYGKSSNFKVNLLDRTEDANARFSNPDNDPRGPWKPIPFLNQVSPEKRPNLCYPIVNPYTGKVTNPTAKAWRNEKKIYEKYLKEGRFWWGINKDKAVPDIKRYLSEVKSGITPINLWEHKYAGNTDDANREIKELFGDKIFDTPKPSLLIKRVIEHICDDDSIIIDFFAGSCTTAHAVLDLNHEDNGNRKFICVQLPEPCDEKSEAYKAGYKTITDIGKERIRRVIKKINTEDKGKLNFEENHIDLGFKVFKLAPSNFKVWNAAVEKNTEAVARLLLDHIHHISHVSREDAILYEILLKSGFELSTKVEKLDLAGKTVYSIAEGALLVCLEKNLTKELFRAIAEKKPARCVCLDKGFQNDDQLKTNAVQTMKDKSVEFRTV
jgi:adenine-specific DNA-methyltransferase